jgi:hypothetical protein
MDIRTIFGDAEVPGSVFRDGFVTFFVVVLCWVYLIGQRKLDSISILLSVLGGRLIEFYSGIESKRRRRSIDPKRGQKE